MHECILQAVVDPLIPPGRSANDGFRTRLQSRREIELQADGRGLLLFNRAALRVLPPPRWGARGIISNLVRAWFAT